MIIISDTSPITNLLAIEHIHLLRELYAEIIIPEGVKEELMRVKSREEQIRDLLSEGWLQVKEITDFKRYQEILIHLDKGESEAITLGLELKAELLLMDETKGRQIAKKFGLHVTGLLGVIMEAKSKGLIPSVKGILDELVGNAGFFVDQNLYEYVLKAAGGE